MIVQNAVNFTQKFIIRFLFFCASLRIGRDVEHQLISHIYNTHEINWRSCIQKSKQLIGRTLPPL